MINARLALELTAIEYLGMHKLNDLENQITNAISKSNKKPIFKTTIESLDGKLIGDNDVKIISRYLVMKGFKISVNTNYLTDDYAHKIDIHW